MNSESNKKFHVENDVIITTIAQIDVEDVFKHLRGRLNDFRDESQFMILCGVHTSKKGEIRHIDHDLTYDYQEMFERFHNHKKYPDEAKIVQEKRFQMGSVFPVASTRDWSKKPDEVYTLSEQSKDHMRIKFEEMKETKKPIVLILASCYSYISDISKFLISCGIFSVLNISEERGKISSGRILRLEDEQKEFLMYITEHLSNKDVIIFGTYLHIFLKIFLINLIF